MKSIYSTESKQLADRLRRARQAAGLSQEDAARALRRSQSYISKVERGQLRVDIVQLRSLAELYRIPLGRLIN